MISQDKHVLISWHTSLDLSCHHLPLFLQRQLPMAAESKMVVAERFDIAVAVDLMGALRNSVN